MLVGLFFSRMSHVFTRQDATDLSKIVLIAAYVQIQYEVTEELEEIWIFGFCANGWWSIYLGIGI